MNEKVFEFGFGDGVVKLSLPEAQILHEIEGRAASEIADVPNAVRTALRQPIGAPSLREVVKPGETVAIIASDVTRAWTRADIFLPVLLDELNAAGIPDRDIFVMVALGAHRPHTEAENHAVYGAEVCRRVKIFQHDASNKDELTYCGVTSRGVETWINKRIKAANLFSRLTR